MDALLQPSGMRLLLIAFAGINTWMLVRVWHCLRDVAAVLERRNKQLAEQTQQLARTYGLIERLGDLLMLPDPDDPTAADAPDIERQVISIEERRNRREQWARAKREVRRLRSELPYA